MPAAATSAGPPEVAAPARPAPSGPSPAQLQLVEALDALEAEAAAMTQALRPERAQQRFVPTLAEWLPDQIATLRQAILAEAGPGLPRALLENVHWLHAVVAEIKELVRQRRDPGLLPLLGDADALAEACYAPVVAFARAEGLPLSSAQPVAQLTAFDLAIWTGFAPTQLAPLFLPPDFFHSALHWPAVAHEIGHDFLVSVRDLRQRLANELGLPDEHQGTLPLRLTAEGIHTSELWRLHGGWLEELFSDAFGTLMCGPAYVHTMVELFSFRYDPREVLAVPIDPETGRYDPHPPHHLRVHAGLALLERMGFHAEARALRQRWHARNQLDPEGETVLLLPVTGRYLPLPFSAFEPMTRALVERLYEGPFDALSGHGLRDISGLDFGPRAEAEAGRAKAALLGGQVPSQRDPRVIIAGAVLAAIEQPQHEAQILERARRAIAGIGTFERAPDAFTPHADAPRAPPPPGAIAAAGLDVSARAFQEAIILGEVLQRRTPRRAARVGRRR